MAVKICPKCKSRMWREGKEWVCILCGYRIMTEKVTETKVLDEQWWKDYFAGRDTTRRGKK